MKHAKRLNQSLKKLDKIGEIISYTTIHTEREMEYQRYLRDLKNDLKYLSIEKKEHRIRFAQKVLSGKFFQRMSFWNRLKFGVKWIINGQV